MALFGNAFRGASGVLAGAQEANRLAESNLLLRERQRNEQIRQQQMEEAQRLSQQLGGYFSQNPMLGTKRGERPYVGLELPMRGGPAQGDMDSINAAYARGARFQPAPGNLGDSYESTIGLRPPSSRDPLQEAAAYDNARTPYDQLIAASATQYGIDPTVFRRLLGTESSFRPDAVSPSGKDFGLGIAQISSVHGLSDEDRLNPEKAIPFAAQLFSQYLEEAGGDIDEALRRYKGATSEEGIRSIQPAIDIIKADLTSRASPLSIQGGLNLSQELPTNMMLAGGSSVDAETIQYLQAIDNLINAAPAEQRAELQQQYGNMIGSITGNPNTPQEMKNAQLLGLLNSLSSSFAPAPAPAPPLPDPYANLEPYEELITNYRRERAEEPSPGFFRRSGEIAREAGGLARDFGSGMLQLGGMALGGIGYAGSEFAAGLRGESFIGPAEGDMASINRALKSLVDSAPTSDGPAAAPGAATTEADEDAPTTEQVEQSVATVIDKGVQGKTVTRNEVETAFQQTSPTRRTIPEIIDPDTFYGADPNELTMEMEHTLNMRRVLASTARMYLMQGTPEAMANVAVVMQDMQALDTGLFVMQGMQGLEELSVSRDPRRLNTVWSRSSNADIQVIPRIDGGYDVSVNGTVRHRNVTEDWVAAQARISFSEASRQQYEEALRKRAEEERAAAAAAAAAEQEARIKMRITANDRYMEAMRDIVIAQNTLERDLAIERAKRQGIDLMETAAGDQYFSVRDEEGNTSIISITEATEAIQKTFGKDIPAMPRQIETIFSSREVPQMEGAGNLLQGVDGLPTNESWLNAIGLGGR